MSGKCQHENVKKVRKTKDCPKGLACAKCGVPMYKNVYGKYAAWNMSDDPLYDDSYDKILRENAQKIRSLLGRT